MRNFLLQLPRRIKKLLLMSLDIFALFIALVISLSLRSEEFYLPFYYSVQLQQIQYNDFALTGLTSMHFLYVYGLSGLITISFFIRFGLYNSIIRYININTLSKIIFACILFNKIFIFRRSARKNTGIYHCSSI